jgi:hypothetical protein
MIPPFESTAVILRVESEIRRLKKISLLFIKILTTRIFLDFKWLQLVLGKTLLLQFNNVSSLGVRLLTGNGANFSQNGGAIMASVAGARFG